MIWLVASKVTEKKNLTELLYKEKKLYMFVFLMFVLFSMFVFTGQISGWAKSEVEKKAKIIKVTCLPLYSILMSMGNPIVDFFSLDIEGAEHLVLKTIPWDKVNIRVGPYVFSIIF